MKHERAILIDGPQGKLIGILHEPTELRSRVGVVVVVGGPQYRVGSQRQFVLLARHLAALGVPTLRFDYTGMGDSDGMSASFERVDGDIRSAVDRLLRDVPTLEGVVLWGLCDGASAALMYSESDPRVRGLVLLNPWVRTSEGLAKAYVRDYYGSRVLNREFWNKVVKRPWTLLEAGRGFLRNLARSRRSGDGDAPAHQPEFLAQMLIGAQRFTGPVMVLLSGNDLTATEFKQRLDGVESWSRAFRHPGVTFKEHPDADHTFSRRAWREWVLQRTSEWLSQEL